MNATVRVSGYPGGSRVFTDQIQTSYMLDDGDSGAVLLAKDGYAVGLCFAGNNLESFANNVQLVEAAARTGVSVVDREESPGEPIEIGWDAAKE